MEALPIFEEFVSDQFHGWEGGREGRFRRRQSEQEQKRHVAAVADEGEHTGWWGGRRFLTKLKSVLISGKVVVIFKHEVHLASTYFGRI